MIGLGIEVCVGVEWFQVKGVVCINVLQREEVKYILRVEIGQVKLEGKDNYNIYFLIIELERILEIIV